MSDDGTLALATMIAHRAQVRLNLHALMQEIERRALGHDLSKLSTKELNGFIRINRTAREHPYGSEEYRASMDAEKGEGGCITLHFSKNSHHPEFHESNASMGFLDIIEMVMDWKAASDTYGNMTLRGSLPHHRERFNFSDEQWWLIGSVVDWIDPEEQGP